MIPDVASSSDHEQGGDSEQSKSNFLHINIIYSSLSKNGNLQFLEEANIELISESQKMIVPLRGNRTRYRTNQKNKNYLQQEKGNLRNSHNLEQTEHHRMKFSLPHSGLHSRAE